MTFPVLTPRGFHSTRLHGLTLLIVHVTHPHSLQSVSVFRTFLMRWPQIWVVSLISVAVWCRQASYSPPYLARVSLGLQTWA